MVAVAQLVRAPVCGTGGCRFDSCRACCEVAALSSRGLGRGPLKAQTRVRIPLALLMELRGFAASHDWTACSAAREDPIGLIVYRLGRHPFTVQRGVRFPLGLLC